MKNNSPTAQQPNSPITQQPKSEAVSEQRSRSTSSFWSMIACGVLIPLLALWTTPSHAQYSLGMDNTATNCAYSVKIFYDLGSCDGNGCWHCNGTGPGNATVSVGAGAFAHYTYPGHCGPCKYEIYDNTNALIFTCDIASASACTCHKDIYADCELAKRQIDMNGGCPVSAIRWY